jgi:hypothetical protein
VAAKVTGVIVAQKAPSPAVVMKWRRFARMAVPSREKIVWSFLVSATMAQGRADQNHQNAAALARGLRLG